MDRTEDSYSEFRNKIMQKVPYDRKNLAKYGFILPDMYALALRLMKDQRVTKRDKVHHRFHVYAILWCLWISSRVKCLFLEKMDDHCHLLLRNQLHS